MLQLILALAPLAVSPGEADLARLEMDTVTLHRRGGDPVVADRGKLIVPGVRADPDSQEVSIEFWRFPAVEGAGEEPPIFKLHGGPGWPGWEPNDIDYDAEILPLVQHADLVVVGQRGIGTSAPDTACGARPNLSDDATAEEVDQALVAACRECRKTWEDRGFDLKGFNVIEAAADVRDIAEFMGYERIVIWGGSFGSHWGMTVMRYHESLVARAVLTGMEGPDHTYDMPSGVLASLERLASAAEGAPLFEGRIPEGGLIEAFRTLVGELETETLELDVDGAAVQITADDLREAALGYTGRASSRRGARSWPADMIALFEGHFETLAQVKLARQRGGRNLPTASFFMLDCGSGISPARLETLQNDPAAAVVGDLGHFYQTACQAWDADLGEAFRADFKTPIPTVIVHGTWDTSTPFDNALELLPSFENGHFIPVDGGSHGALEEALGDSTAFRASIMEFVRTGETSQLPKEYAMPPLDWVAPYAE